MTVGDPALPVTRFDFTGGLLRGSHLALFPTCLVHRGEQHFETLPLAHLSSVRVAFVRDLRKLVWAGILLFIALVLFAIASPLGEFASGAAAEMQAAGSQGVARGLLAFFHFLGAVASVLPALGFACALGGAALAALGWIGETTLTIAIPGAERVFSTRGRNPRLLDFSEALSERIMARGQ